mgnify:CR=1 FL=1
MNSLLLIVAFICVVYFVNKKFSKNNSLVNYTGQIHQKYSGFKKIPLSGGVFFTIFCIIILFEFSSLLCLFIFLIFLTGIISDLNLVKSPKFRFFLQLLFIGAFVLFFDVTVYPTRLMLLDILLSNTYLSFAFSIFCLLILINGSNFIDGLNGLLLGYFVLILMIIYFLNIYSTLNILI